MASWSTWARLNAARVFSKVRTALLGPYATGILVHTPEGEFIVPACDAYVGRHLAFRGEYNKAEVTLLKSLLHPHSRVCIVGPHVGALLVPIAKTCGSVVAYEANPAIHRLLQLNIWLNGLTNCTAHNLALGDQEHDVPFWANRINTGGSKVAPPTPCYEYVYDHPETVVVSMTTLDRHSPDADFDLVVMDVEGSEYKALRGMQRALTSTRHLLLEFCPHHLENIALVSNAELLRLLKPHFDELTISGQRVSPSRFLSSLDALTATRTDANLLFSKSAGRYRPGSPP